MTDTRPHGSGLMVWLRSRRLRTVVSVLEMVLLLERLRVSIIDVGRDSPLRVCSGEALVRRGSPCAR